MKRVPYVLMARSMEATPPLKIVNSPVENVAFKDMPKTRFSSFAFLTTTNVSDGLSL